MHIRQTPILSLLLLAAASPLSLAQLATTQPTHTWTAQGVVPKNWPAGALCWFAVPVAEGPVRPMRAGATLLVGDDPITINVSGEYVPNVRGSCGGSAWLRWVVSEASLGKPIRVTLQLSDTPPQKSIFNHSYAEPTLEIKDEKGKPVLSYLHGPPIAGQKYPLTDFIHPLFGLDGEILTAQSPKDHVHHRGVFWAWVRNDRQGKRVGDWWAPNQITCEPGELHTDDGPFISSFHARHWLVYTPKGADKGERFIQEDFVCRVFPAQETGRAVDLDISLSALEDGVRIGGQTQLNKGYGGLTVRFNAAKEVRIDMDGQHTPEDVIGGRARWADWTGIFNLSDGSANPRRSGVAVLVHPSHPDNPPAWLTRYYGVLNVAYPGLGMLDIGKDKPLRLRYRLWIHRGTAEEGGVEDQYRAYSADWQWQVKSNP